VVFPGPLFAATVTASESFESVLEFLTFQGTRCLPSAPEEKMVGAEKMSCPSPLDLCHETVALFRTLPGYSEPRPLLLKYLVNLTVFAPL